MVVHVFTAERYHLVPTIVKGFATFYSKDTDHRFILHGTKTMNKGIYERLFEDIGFSNYYFSHSYSQLVCYLWKNRLFPILFHAGSYSHFVISFLLRCTNVNWVCWGSGSAILNSKLSKISAPIKKCIYKRFKTIITLMEEDRQSLIRDFRLNPENVVTIPYASGGGKSPREEISLQLFKNVSKKNRKTIILLGNNPGNIPYYIWMMKNLVRFKGKIQVHCMMNYSLKKDKEYVDFISMGRSLFENDFYSDEIFYSDDDYVRYMNVCDIYICANPNQSGLGAIGTCLMLGKKIYLTGKNLSWIRSFYNAIVFDISEIDNGDDFLISLTNEERNHNRNSFINKLKEPALLWHHFFMRL